METQNLNEEFDILSFDASQLDINTPHQSVSSITSVIYKPRPVDSKSEDGVYRAQIKVIYNPFNLKQSIIEQQSYMLKDETGYFNVVSSLTNNDTSCPVFKAWKVCRYSKDPKLQAQQLKVEEGGKGLFDKRFARYVTIQVLDDQNNPDLNGKYMFWKMPKAVWDVINAKQSPTNPQKAAIPVMDFLFGRAIDLEVYPGPGKPGDDRYTRETKYMCELTEETVPCVNPDMSSLLTSEQEDILEQYISDMKDVWKEKNPETRMELKKKVEASSNTIALKNFYRDIIEKIKTFCPNLTETLGYIPWSEETTIRVNNWISKVLKGEDPTIPEVAVIPSTPSASVNSTDADYNTDTTDDLPF